MEMNGSWGGLLPLWILGAPWILSLLELMRTPHPRAHHAPPPAVAPPAYGRPA
ncbi:hypothetical protein [Rubrivivax gelatinosus]|uniref:Uncharacterized protein n=1 Tax=Rubrivivax gelatinosus TaxID=28068 RepID=A0A4R2MWE8_RUBGE|nr:hypothetical protein [Rubrivivax gelatinosus]TCP04343.1 hypothetical protein EV684_10296 [Rubrivivax gelatinosus]